MSFSSLEDLISLNNPLRFVDALSLVAIGFNIQTVKTEGRPSFDTKVFLKIYLYGYLNGLRSSRKLEKECERNIELQWLLCGLVPNYHSISDFRKQNLFGLKKLFKLFMTFLKDADLISRIVLSLRRTKSWFPTFPTSRWSGILYSKNNRHITLLKVVENLMMLYIGMVVGGSYFFSFIYSSVKCCLYFGFENLSALYSFELPFGMESEAQFSLHNSFPINTICPT